MTDELNPRANHESAVPFGRLHAEIDVELAEVEASSDVFDNDDPERGPYETRLRNLHDAVVAVEVAAVEVTVEVRADGGAGDESGRNIVGGSGQGAGGASEPAGEVATPGS